MEAYEVENMKEEQYNDAKNEIVRFIREEIVDQLLKRGYLPTNGTKWSNSVINNNLKNVVDAIMYS